MNAADLKRQAEYARVRAASVQQLVDAAVYNAKQYQKQNEIDRASVELRESAKLGEQVSTLRKQADTFDQQSVEQSRKELEAVKKQASDKRIADEQAIKKRNRRRVIRLLGRL
ncbi:MAG: hypothetical protein ABIR91_05750 [Candidatus Saccharimonadales bacterium]